jgi:hypothetical protein
MGVLSDEKGEFFQKSPISSGGHKGGMERTGWGN